MSSLARSRTWNRLVGSFHPTLITLGVWIIGGAALIICEGDAICDALFLAVDVILIIRFWPVVTSGLYDVLDVVIGLDNLSSEEGAPQCLILLYCLLPFDFKGAQMSFKIEDQVELYRGKLGQDIQESLGVSECQGDFYLVR